MHKCYDESKCQHPSVEISAEVELKIKEHNIIYHKTLNDINLLFVDFLLQYVSNKIKRR